MTREPVDGERPVPRNDALERTAQVRALADRLGDLLHGLLPLRALHDLCSGSRLEVTVASGQAPAGTQARLSLHGSSGSGRLKAQLDTWPVLLPDHPQGPAPGRTASLLREPGRAAPDDPFTAAVAWLVSDGCGGRPVRSKHGRIRFVVPLPVLPALPALPKATVFRYPPLPEPVPPRRLPPVQGDGHVLLPRSLDEVVGLVRDGLLGPGPALVELVVEDHRAEYDPDPRDGIRRTGLLLPDGPGEAIVVHVRQWRRDLTSQRDTLVGQPDWRYLDEPDLVRQDAELALERARGIATTYGWAEPVLDDGAALLLLPAAGGTPEPLQHRGSRRDDAPVPDLLAARCEPLLRRMLDAAAHLEDVVLAATCSVPVGGRQLQTRLVIAVHGWKPESTVHCGTWVTRPPDEDADPAPDDLRLPGIPLGAHLDRRLSIGLARRLSRMTGGPGVDTAGPVPRFRLPRGPKLAGPAQELDTGPVRPESEEWMWCPLVAARLGRAWYPLLSLATDAALTGRDQVDLLTSLRDTGATGHGWLALRPAEPGVWSVTVRSWFTHGAEPDPVRHPAPKEEDDWRTAALARRLARALDGTDVVTDGPLARFRCRAG